MNLFKLIATIGLDSSEYEQGVKDAIHSGNHLAEHAKSVGSGMVSATKMGIKAIGTGVAAAGTAISAVTTAAVKSYAEYEQLVGGVETLFKESADTVMHYADAAYKTAGLSANAYMEQATSFSASLLQSLNNDTAAAAEYANTAIVDMADNANKMGTSIESIQYAYNGFAKGNYVMLDNLKLGYGGTAREMARLINDSGILGEEYIDLGDKANLGAALQEVGFARMVEAIHIVQTEMGISGISAEEAAELVASGAMTQAEAFELMGTTAKEASSTIEGSINSAKAAYTNLITGISDDNADLEVLIDEFVDAAAVAAENILPRIEIALNGAGKLIEKLTPVIIGLIPKIVTDMLPNMIKSGVSIIQKILEGFKSDPDTVVESVLTIVDLLVDAFIDLFPELISTGADMLVRLIDAFAAHPDKVITGALEVIGALVGGLLDAAGQIIDAAGRLIASLVTGLVDHWDDIKEQGKEILNKILDGWEHALGSIPKAVDKFLAAIMDAIGRGWEKVKDWFGGLWDSLFNRDANVNVHVNHYENSKPVAKPTSGTRSRSRSPYTAVAIDGSHADGLDYVPFDGYIAELHEGEKVLTKDEAKHPPVVVNQYIYSQAQTAADLQEEARYKAEEAVFVGV